MADFTDFTFTEDPFGGQSGSFFDQGEPMFLDTQTGQLVTAFQAQQLDPVAFQASFEPLLPVQQTDLAQQVTLQNARNPAWVQAFEQAYGGPHPELIGLPPEQLAGLKDFQQFTEDENNLLPFLGPGPSGGGFLQGLGDLLGGLGTAKGIAGTLGGLTALLGAAGVVQGLLGGDRQTQQTIQRAVAAASPEERQAFTAALQQAQGNPAAVAERLQSRVPQEEQAYGAGLGGAQQQLQAAQQLQTLLNPQLVASLGPLLQQQQETFRALGPVSQGMAQGQLPSLSPELRSQVGQVFAGREQDLNRYVDQAVQQAIERARNQGFAGGLDLLQGAPPATALLAPALAEAVRQRGALAGQQALSELELSQNLPLNAANIAQAYNTPLALRLAGLNNLGTLTQGAINPLINSGQAGPGAQNQLISALTSLTGTQAQNRGSTQNQITTAPRMTLLDAFAPTAQLLGGVGGLLNSGIFR